MPSASASVKLLCAETDDWAASKSTAEQRDWRLALILNSKLWCWNIGQCWSHVWKEQQYQNSGVVLQFVTSTRQPKLRSLPFPVQNLFDSTNVHQSLFPPQNGLARGSSPLPSAAKRKKKGKELFGLRRRFRNQFYLYSKISPGWHPKALHTASNVDKRIAFAFPFFNTEILAIVIPTFSASSVTLIFLFASITSMLMIIAISLNS